VIGDPELLRKTDYQSIRSRKTENQRDQKNRERNREKNSDFLSDLCFSDF